MTHKPFTFDLKLPPLFLYTHRLLYVLELLSLIRTRMKVWKMTLLMSIMSKRKFWRWWITLLVYQWTFDTTTTYALFMAIYCFDKGTIIPLHYRTKRNWQPAYDADNSNNHVNRLMKPQPLRTFNSLLKVEASHCEANFRIALEENILLCRFWTKGFAAFKSSDVENYTVY